MMCPSRAAEAGRFDAGHTSLSGPDTGACASLDTSASSCTPAVSALYQWASAKRQAKHGAFVDLPSVICVIDDEALYARTGQASQAVVMRNSLWV